VTRAAKRSEISAYGVTEFAPGNKPTRCRVIRSVTGKEHHLTDYSYPVCSCYVLIGQKLTMDWNRAIERNSEALKAIVAALFAMLGDTTAARLPRELHRAVLGILRPAESALRRLIVIAARGMVAKPVSARPMPTGLIIRGGGNRLSFPLFDRRKRFGSKRRITGPRALPRIHIFGSDPRIWAPRSAPPPAPPPDDGRVNARRLCLRLQALKFALDDLPRQARRLVRLKAKRETVPGLRFRLPLRPGRPPGYRRIAVHDVDRVLVECHGLAFDALQSDTS
jgi:hypothetical protein